YKHTHTHACYYLTCPLSHNHRPHTVSVFFPWVNSPRGLYSYTSHRGHSDTDWQLPSVHAAPWRTHTHTHTPPTHTHTHTHTQTHTHTHTHTHTPIGQLYNSLRPNPAPHPPPTAVTCTNTGMQYRGALLWAAQWNKTKHWALACMPFCGCLSSDGRLSMNLLHRCFSLRH